VRLSLRDDRDSGDLIGQPQVTGEDGTYAADGIHIAEKSRGPPKLTKRKIKVMQFLSHRLRELLSIIEIVTVEIILISKAREMNRDLRFKKGSSTDFAICPSTQKNPQIALKVFSDLSSSRKIRVTPTLLMASDRPVPEGKLLAR